VTHSIGERLVRDYGHEIHVLAINHRGDDYPSLLNPKQSTPLRLYRPKSINPDDLYGFTRVVELLGKLGERDEEGLDVVVMFNDPQVILQYLFDNDFDPNRILLQYRPIISYIPCDGTNLPGTWTDLLPKTTNVVAMSKWGQQHYEGSQLVYHGVDTDRFWPVRKKAITLSNGTVCRSKKDCKKAFGIPDPDGFLIGRVDKNSGRKDYGAFMRAVGPLMRKHTDISLYLHCGDKEKATGADIPLTMQRWLSPEELKTRVSMPILNTFVDMPDTDMNALYNAFDLFVSTTRGEGFGMTMAESLAVGVPVIAQNVSAIPEVVGPGGILLEPSGVMVTNPSGEDLWMPNVGAFSEAIEHLYLAGGVRRKLGEAGLEHVRSSFSWDVAASKFHEFISAFTDAAKEELTHG
jgi:glycosyltransferase involved in cell wall biosynthesis